VVFGGLATAAGNLTVHAGTVIGGMSGVASDVPSGSQLWGVPAFDRRRWRRAVSVFKNLPELARRVRRLEKQAGKGSDEPEE